MENDKSENDSDNREGQTFLLLTQKEYYRAMERYEEHKDLPTAEDFFWVVEAPDGE